MLSLLPLPSRGWRLRLGLNGPLLALYILLLIGLQFLGVAIGCVLVDIHFDIVTVVVPRDIRSGRRVDVLRVADLVSTTTAIIVVIVVFRARVRVRVAVVVVIVANLLVAGPGRGRGRPAHGVATEVVRIGRGAHREGMIEIFI